MSDERDGKVGGAAAGERTREPMHRIRVGVTGLAAVILVLAVAFAIATSIRRNETIDNASTTAVVAANAVDTEPLATLGVAPAKKNEQEPAR